MVDGAAVAPTTNAITYGSVNNATVDTISNLPLGEFQVAPLAANMTTTYANTPFSFTLIPSAYNGAALTNFTPLTVNGVLNGTLTGDSQSSVIATITSIPNDTFQLGNATQHAGWAAESSAAGAQLGRWRHHAGSRDQHGRNGESFTGARARAQHHRLVPEHGRRSGPPKIRSGTSPSRRRLT